MRHRSPRITPIVVGSMADLIGTQIAAEQWTRDHDDQSRSRLDNLGERINNRPDDRAGRIERRFGHHAW